MNTRNNIKKTGTRNVQLETNCSVNVSCITT